MQHAVSRVGARNPERAAPRLARVLEDLEHVFMREGFLHLRTEDLAERLRCSKRALYQLAGSREELFEIVIERWLANLRRAGEEAARRATDPFSAVTGYLGVAVTATREASGNFVRDLARFPAGHRRLMRHQRERIDGLERLIDEGTARGAFRGLHPKLVAEVLLVAVARMVEPEVLAHVELSMSQAFDELYKIFEYGLIQQAKPRRAGKLRKISRADGAKLTRRRAAAALPGTARSRA